MVGFYLSYIITALLYAECAVGIILNAFIVVTNFQNWRTLKTFPTLDKILSCLGTSRCLLLFHMMFRNVLLQFFPGLYQNLALRLSLLVGTMLLNFTNLWFATILCVFYCVKITNYRHKLFIFLKTRISSLVHWFILASLLISVACSLPCGWYVLNIDQIEFNSGSGENMTITNVMVYRDLHNRFLLFQGGSLLPFLIFCAAMFLLIQSLWRHIRLMRGSGTGFRSPNLEVHFCAVKSMSLFLVLHVAFFICMNLLLSPTHHINLDWKKFMYITMCSLPFLHSLYIIFSTRKLKETFLRWFCCR